MLLIYSDFGLIQAVFQFTFFLCRLNASVSFEFNLGGFLIFQVNCLEF